MRNTKILISHARLLELLDYDAATGVFRWRVDRAGGVKARDVAGCSHIHHGGQNRWQIVVERNHYKAHRLAWFYMTGRWPIGIVDHINGDMSDNRFCNLRLASPIQNAANSTHRPGATGVRGVCFFRNRYMAQISHNGRSVYIGRFKTLKEAEAAWRKKAIDLRGEFAKLS